MNKLKIRTVVVNDIHPHVNMYICICMSLQVYLHTCLYTSKINYTFTKHSATYELLLLENLTT